MTHSIHTPYDSEQLAIARVMRQVEQLQNQRRNPQDVVDQITESFAKIGLIAKVRAYTTGAIERKGGIEQVEEVPGLYSFDVEIIGRADRHEFDHDQMRHEVQNNLLGLEGMGGTVNSGLTDPDLDALVRKHSKGHQH
jgi:hypothetical protein